MSVTEVNFEQPFDANKDRIVGKGRLRCAWEVVAGVLPGTPMPVYTRRWFLCSDIFYAEAEQFTDEYVKANPDAKSSFMQLRDDAHEYAKELTHPSYVNWVRVEFLWY